MFPLGTFMHFSLHLPALLSYIFPFVSLPSFSFTVPFHPQGPLLWELPCDNPVSEFWSYCTFICYNIILFLLPVIKLTAWMLFNSSCISKGKVFVLPDILHTHTLFLISVIWNSRDCSIWCGILLLCNMRGLLVKVSVPPSTLQHASPKENHTEISIKL